MRYSAQVGPRGTMDAHFRFTSFQAQNLERVDVDLDGLQLDRLVLSSQRVCRFARDFFGRYRRRRLQERAPKMMEDRVDRRPFGRDTDLGRRGLAIRIVSVGGESEVNHAFVDLVVTGIK